MSVHDPDASETAVVLLLSRRGQRPRYFSGFGKARQVQTAWSVAGARLFGPWIDDEIAKIENRAIGKGWTVARATVTVRK